MAPTVWLSRPPSRADALAQTLAENNITPLLCPAMHIAAPAGGGSLDTYLSSLDDFAVSIFISREAAVRVAAVLPPGEALPALAIGGKTAAALPPRYRLLAQTAAISDSQQLLQEKTLKQCSGQVAVLGGTDETNAPPAPPLTAALRARGNAVLPVICYRRLPAARDETLNARGRDGQLHAAVAYSGDSLRYMLRMTSPDNGWLRRLPLFVIHANIAATAYQLGFEKIITAENDELATCIVRYLKTVDGS